MKESKENLPLKSGVNHCHWNVQGKCTNPDVTRRKLDPGHSHDWDSHINCTYTILGVHLCSGYGI